MQETSIISKKPPQMILPSKSAYLKKRLVMSGLEQEDGEDNGGRNTLQHHQRQQTIHLDPYQKEFDDRTSKREKSKAVEIYSQHAQVQSLKTSKKLAPEALDIQGATSGSVHEWQKILQKNVFLIIFFDCLLSEWYNTFYPHAVTAGSQNPMSPSGEGDYRGSSALFSNDKRSKSSIRMLQI